MFNPVLDQHYIAIAEYTVTSLLQLIVLHHFTDKDEVAVAYLTITSATYCRSVAITLTTVTLIIHQCAI